MAENNDFKTIESCMETNVFNDPISYDKYNVSQKPTNTQQQKNKDNINKTLKIHLKKYNV